MTDADPHDQIARLETQIDELADTIEGCRKIVLMAKVAIAGGALVLAAMLFGVLRFDPVVLTAATAALLGGIVTSGSNGATAQQATAKMKEAERLKAELIGRLHLHVVPPME
jgi:hypothetical protein